jgi:uncharacterized protein YdcH (DUF465 family)
MAKIEIPIDEYNSLHDKIKELEKGIGNVLNESNNYKEKILALKDMVSDLENEPLVNRMFKWDSVVEPFKEFFNNEKSKNS